LVLLTSQFTRAQASDLSHSQLEYFNITNASRTGLLLSQWYDQTGNGRTLTPINNVYPQINTNGTYTNINGEPALDLTSGRYLLKTATTPTWLTGAYYSINFVYKLPSIINGYRFILGTLGSGTDKSLQVGWREDPNVFTLAQWGDDINFTMPQDATNAHVVTTIKNSGGKLYRDQNQITTASGNPANNLNPQSELYLGCAGSTNAFSQDYFKGFISELVMYSSAMSTSDRQTLEASQKSLFGTP
jgi:hypothetical protein